MPFDFVSQYSQKLITDAGLATLPQEYLEEYQTRLEDQIVRRMGIVAMENLDDKGIDAYREIIEESGGDLSKINRDHIASFWRKYIPNFEPVMLKGLEDFAQEFLSAAKAKEK